VTVPGRATRTARSYEVRHTTQYTYDDEVTASYGRTFVTPRDLPTQVCRSARIVVDPAPALLSEHVDSFDNRTTYFEVHRAHRRLSVTAVNQVEVSRQRPDLSVLSALTWEEAAAQLGAAADGGPGDDLDVVAVRTFLLPSPLVASWPQVAAWAREVLTPGRPVAEALPALAAAIHTQFTYRSGATDVGTTLPELLRRRAGVCQDFAHLAVGALRSVGLPARYVSGYLETDPPPGRPRLQGADATHAWASVLLPSMGWVDLDPTNNQLVDDRYVVAAWGRDYTDVPPVKGVIFTEASASDMHVAVDVVRTG
jgi:transglutaminase-like putative cysteine protease